MRNHSHLNKVIGLSHTGKLRVLQQRDGFYLSLYWFDEGVFAFARSKRHLARHMDAKAPA